MDGYKLSINDYIVTDLLIKEEETSDIQELNEFLTKSFLHELPTFLEFFDNIQNPTDDHLTQSINACNKFSQFSPKEKVAQILLENGVIDRLFRYVSIDLIEWLSNQVACQNILKVFNIFGEISKSTDCKQILRMIQCGVLELCIKNYHIFNDTLNKSISFILNNFIGSSFYSRGIVYSTNILSSFITNAAEYDDELPLLMNRFISSLAVMFVSKGPTIGSQIPDESENPDACAKFWDDFMENYIHDNIFDRELYNSFVKNGITIEKGNPVFTICNTLILLNDELCLLNLTKIVYIFVSRDCAVYPYKTTNDVLYSRINFLNNLSVFFDTQNDEILYYALNIVIAVYSPDNIKAPDDISNDISSMIIHFFLEHNFEFNERILVASCHALTNILFTSDSGFLSDDDECASLLSFIEKCLTIGSYNVRKAALHFYLTLAYQFVFYNPLITQSFKKNVGLIIDISEEIRPNPKMNRKFIHTFQYIFEKEEMLNSTEFFDQFNFNHGFDLIYALMDDKSDMELVNDAESFYEQFNVNEVELFVNDLINESRKEDF